MPRSAADGITSSLSASQQGEEDYAYDWATAETREGMRHVTAQLGALTKKNGLLLKRRRCSTLCYIMVPSLVVLGLALLDASLSPTHFFEGDEGAAPLRVRKCTRFNSFGLPDDSVTSSSCVTAAFAPNAPEHVAIMQAFAEANDLEYGTDVVAAESADAVARMIVSDPGSVDAGVIFMEDSESQRQGFCTEPTCWAAGARTNTATRLRYEMWVNATAKQDQWAFGEDSDLLKLASVQGHYAAVQQAVDAAIIGTLAGLRRSADVQIDVGRFAELYDARTDVGGEVVTNSGDVFVVLGCSLSAILVLQNIAGEKDTKLLAALRTVGLREWLHWTSWGLCYFVPCVLSALLSTCLGNISGLRLFTHASFAVHFLTMLLFLQSFAAFSTFLGSFISRTRYVVVVSMVMLLVVLNVMIITAEMETGPYPYHYGQEASWASWLALSGMPWYHFSRVFKDIATTTYEGNQSLPQYFSVSDLANTTVYFTNRYGEAYPTDDYCDDYSYGYNRCIEYDRREYPDKQTEYSTGSSLWAQLFLILFYNVAAWYFGQTSSSDEGASQKCCFCLNPSYWRVKERPLAMDEGNRLGVEKSKSSLEQSVRCYKLSKSYAEETVLKELSMAIESSSCMALLGHNGAGKTTLVNTLTGIHPPTHGEAFIFGLDVRKDVAQLQKIMGVCHQEDLLWLDLTAREHLRIYSQFKGIAGPEIEEHVMSILEAVNLVEEADNQVSTFSGGMKRRLAVGISSVAAPRIIFLDEPTTGMDPLSRRRVWDMIQRLKANRIMLLTTHSMEEADALGDSVAILDSGKLRACGTSQFLKRTFGKGHTIMLMSEPDQASRVADIVSAVLPSAEIMNSNAGNTSISLPKTAMKGLPRLFAALMVEEGLIQEWSVSNTTLEEVFMRLAAQNDMNAAVEGVGNSVTRVSIVRREKRLTVEQDANEEVLVIIDGLDSTDVSALEVISPEETEEHETVVVPLADADEVNPETDGIVMEQLILPSNAVGGDSDNLGMVDNASMQMIDVVVPMNATPGQEITLTVGGSDVRVPLPIAAEPGSRIQVAVPLPQAAADAPLSNAEVLPTTVWQQAYAIAWKNFYLTLNCRRGPGLRGCCNVKCCELTCYGIIFAIMAVMALINGLDNEENQRMDSDTAEAVHRASTAAYCSNGVQETIMDTSWYSTDLSYTEANGGPVKGIYKNHYDDYYGYQDPVQHYGLVNCEPSDPRSHCISVCDVESTAAVLTSYGSMNSRSALVWTACDESAADSSCWASLIRDRAQASQGLSSVEQEYQSCSAYDGDCYNSDDCGTAAEVRTKEWECTSTIANDYHSGSGLPCRKLPSIWVSEPPELGDTTASELNLFPRPGMTWQQASSLGGGYTHMTDNIFLEFLSIPDGEVNSRVLDVQSDIRDHSSYVYYDVCQGQGLMWLLGNASNIDSAHASVSASELRELEEASRQAAAEYIYGQFPALSLELDQSRVYETEIKLHYKARIWSHEEDAPRSWDSYMYAHVYYSGDRYSSTRYNNYYLAQGTCNELPSQRCGAAAATYQVNMELQVQGIISAVSNALIRTAIGKDVSLQVRMVPMPPVNFNLQSEQNEVARRGRNNGSLMLWIIMFPLITMLLIPSLCSMIASEKESGLLETIKLEGGRIQSYFIGTAGFCFSYSVAFSTTFIIMLVGSGATGSGSEVYVPAGSAVALIISGSVAQAGYVLFVGLCGYVFISKSRNAALLGIMMVLMSVMVSWFMVVSYGQTEAFEGHNALEAGLISGAPWVLLFLSPPLAYSQACSMMLWYNGAQDFWRCIAWLWIDGIVYSAAAVAYTQTQKGALKGFLRSPWNKTSGESDSDLDVVSTGGGVSTLFQGDDDVEKERTRVVAGNSSEVAAAAIVMRNLVKSYESVSHGRRVSKRAVNELCLAVQTNEIFGLLGPNGAGKTTTISMLTGLERPSGGSATIGGFDVETQIRLVHKKIGVCPQFDHLWPEMSVRQHLIFFALLKGTPRKETELAARQLAEDVHLDGDVYNKVASKLSGGEKRRLSIAIALTGSPPVTFFDEPTTGLDPAVRRNIWSIIKAQQAEGRCIVITTHSMEEADSLCDRIGIMAGGGLRCLGTQTHLKTKFGDGFKVVMTADSVSRSAEIEALMLSLSPGAKLAYNTGKQFTYTVPLASGDVAQVFNTMETSRRAHGIVDWGITQASLEEVFIKVVTAWEDESLNVTRLAERHRPSLVGDQL